VGDCKHLRKEVFFSEEKKQKTFARLARFYPAAYANAQKFFASFFQKRRPSFLRSPLPAQPPQA
jgi:hypothetical protein